MAQYPYRCQHEHEITPTTVVTTTATPRTTTDPDHARLPRR